MQTGVKQHKADDNPEKVLNHHLGFPQLVMELWFVFQSFEIPKWKELFNAAAFE